jgi:hypothetical protein
MAKRDPDLEKEFEWHGLDIGVPPGPADLAGYIAKRGRPVCEAMSYWLSGDVPVPSLAEFRARFGWGERDFRGPIAPFFEAAALIEERTDFVEEFGFAVPTREALDCLAGFSPLLEIGAGSGAWTRLLAMRGANIIATDPGEETFILIGMGQRQRRGRWEKHYHPILPLEGKRAVRRWPDRNVFCSWPSLNQTWLRQAARAMRRGRALIVVREDAAADDRTWDYIESAFRPAGAPLRLPNWHFLHDWLEAWVKK